MVIVAFQPGEKYAVNYTTLDQYDYGQILRIQGLKLPKTVEVHFSTQETGGTSLDRVGITKDGVTDVPIPDSVLENGDTTQNYSIFAFVYVTDATSGKTEYRAKLEVKARPKPEVPGGGDNPDIFHEAVLEVRKSAEKAEEAQKQAEGYAHGREDLPERAEDNAMHYAGKASEDAKKTATDRKEVERLVESVSGIDEQVTKVEGLSKNAQEAATQAGTSAEQAELHKQAAETASSAAQTAEQETEADRTSVEKTKETVENLSAQVQKNKDSVDKTVQDFALKAQQALADVNNAGQAQTERVQTAGTTAVENIKTAQDTATRAVETAKTEAVKTVADKGKEVLEAIPDFNAKLETKLDKNQGAEHAGKALVIGEDGNVVPGEVQTEGVGDAADAIVETASGTLLNIKDSAERKNKGFEMSGKTEQVQTTGAQLLDEQLLLNINSPNYDKTTSASGIIWYTFPVEGAITISVKNNKNEEFLKVTAEPDKSGGVWLSHRTSATSKTATLTPKDGNIYLGVNNNLTQIKAMLKNTGGIMINKGETAKSYEPYTGGKPSPSPEYPQEIINAGRWNSDTGKYEIDVKVADAEQNWVKEQTLTLTSDRHLTKWDRLVEREGQIGWLYGSKSYKVTGKENFESREGYNTDSHTNRFFALNDLPRDKSTLKPLAYVEKLKHVLYCYDPNIKEEGFDTNSNQFHIKLSNDRVGILASDDSTVRTSKFSEYMKKIYEDGKPIELLYMTTDTTFTPLPQEQQNAIRALKTYYPTTVVTNSEDAEMQLTYVADTKNFILKEIAKYHAQVQAQQLATLSLLPDKTQATMIEKDQENLLGGI